MANVWMTMEQFNAPFPFYNADTFGDIWSVQYLNTDNEYVDCPSVDVHGAYDRGVNDTTCDMSWWTGGGSVGTSRYIRRYNPYCTRFSADQPVMSARRLKIHFPIYMRNVKYLDIAFLIGVDLEFARGASLSSYNDVSGIAYTKDGESLKLYCVPTPGNDHPGTARLAEGSYGPGFIPFHFVYNDEENPIDIDFIEIESSGVYTERHPTLQYDYFSFWIVQPCYNDDVEFVNDPQPEEQGGNWGDDTGKAGGDGTFSAPSDNYGDRAGTVLISAISTANTTFKTVLGGNYNLYYVPPADLTKILAVLYSSDYFQRFENSMYNPLSAVLNCALIPEIFCVYSADTVDMTAGGYNISQHIFPNPIKFANPEPLICKHIGDVDIINYFGGFPDFAPHTQCKLHLPYIGEIAIDTNKIAHGTLSVDYVCDVMSGNVTAWIWCDDKDGNHTYCYNATGNCAYSIPLFASSSDGSAIGKIIGGVASISAGNVFSGIGSIAEGVESVVSHNTEINGTFSGNVGLTTNPKCFLEISRPQWVNPAQYQKQNGIPSQISGKISDFRGGFFQVETVDLENLPATDTEIAELEQMLKDGIYYNFE